MDSLLGWSGVVREVSCRSYKARAIRCALWPAVCFYFDVCARAVHMTPFKAGVANASWDLQTASRVCCLMPKPLKRLRLCNTILIISEVLNKFALGESAIYRRRSHQMEHLPFISTHP